MYLFRGFIILHIQSSCFIALASETASLSDWTSGQSKNFKKRVKAREKRLLNYLLHSNFGLQMIKKILKIILSQFLGPTPLF